MEKTYEALKTLRPETGRIYFPPSLMSWAFRSHSVMSVLRPMRFRSQRNSSKRLMSQNSRDDRCAFDAANLLSRSSRTSSQITHCPSKRIRNRCPTTFGSSLNPSRKQTPQKLRPDGFRPYTPRQAHTLTRIPMFIQHTGLPPHAP